MGFNCVIWESCLVVGWLNLAGLIICILVGFISGVGWFSNRSLVIWLRRLRCSWFWVDLVSVVLLGGGILVVCKMVGSCDKGFVVGLVVVFGVVGFVVILGGCGGGLVEGGGTLSWFVNDFLCLSSRNADSALTFLFGFVTSFSTQVSGVGCTCNRFFGGQYTSRGLSNPKLNLTSTAGGFYMKMTLHRPTPPPGTLLQIWRDKRQCKPTQS